VTSPAGLSGQRLHLRVGHDPGRHLGPAHHDHALRTDSGSTAQTLHQRLRPLARSGRDDGFPHRAEKAWRRDSASDLASASTAAPARRRLSPPASAARGRVNRRRDTIGPRYHGLPRRLGQGSSKAELRLDRKGLTGTGIAGMVRSARDLGGEHKAHGRNERRVAGNGDMTQRTRQRSKALKSAASRDSDESCAPPLRWGPALRTERPRLRPRTHPGSSFGRLRGEPPLRPPGASQLLVVIRLPATPPMLRHRCRWAILTRQRRELRPPHAACVR
jgi:hypothetical protein